MALQANPYLQRIELDFDSVESLEDYPFHIPAIRELYELKFHPDVTFFVGENGSGKSTLLEAIAVGQGFGAEGGTKNMQFATAQTVSPLHRHLKFSKSFKKPRDYFFLRAEFLQRRHLRRRTWLSEWIRRQIAPRSLPW